jgi:uncharacterized iron-regulated membrane protein
MKRVRTAVFWIHLAAGVAAGLVILVMSITGALLALKPQILNAIEKDVRFVTPPPAAARLGVHAIVARVQRERPGARPATVTLLADRGAAAAVALGRDGTIYVDPYSGRVLGEGSKRAQTLFRIVEDWHRWLAVSADNRASARSVTGASNLAFFLLAVTGPYLWWPRSWSWSSVRAIIWFRRVRNGRARDFNWHNVIGLWCAPVLVVLTITGVVMSYPWANALLFQLAGSPAPISGAGAGAPAAGPRGAEAPPAQLPDNLDALWSRAEEQVPTWRAITARLPARAGAPAAFTIVDRRSWNAFARSQLTVDVATANVSKWEPYEASSRGQKWRGWVRFGHTGELGGLPGQIAAGLASAGGAMLVWTGLTLAFRRLLAWRRPWSRTIESVSTTGARSLSSADR